MYYLYKNTSAPFPLAENDLKKVSRELLLEVLKRGDFIRVRARGSSMGYIIKQGDLITVKGIEDEELKTGDIILYSQEDGFVCHRIISHHQSDGKFFYVTKGDVLLQADAPLPASQVIGKVFCVQRGRRSIDLEGKLARWVGYCAAWYSKLISFFYNKYGFYRSTWENPGTSRWPSGLRKNFERMLRLPIKLLCGLLILTSKSSFKPNKS